ncbi:PAS domain S-box-containing protein [Pedobacter sp. CAN_A7]|uniref:PAS domain-containing sensor histidine kinase n=1 Tax=Pedobacter sp. CAN_A7 TaxID=2787722 RepID=UPI0018CAD256
MESAQTLVTRIAALEQENIELRAAAANAEREAKAAAYQESRTIFETIFESSRLGNKIINSDLTIIEANMAMITLLGYAAKSDLIGKKITDYAPENRREDWVVLQEKLWQNRTPYFSLETCLTKADGTIVWCHVTSILFSDHGETLGYTIIEDVTEQHNLRVQKEQFISVASHELKTPITSVKAISQLLSRQLTVGTPVSEVLFKLLQDSDRQVTKLVRLVDDLLSTTKLEQGQLSLNKSVFVLSDITDAIFNHLQIDDKHRLVFRGEQNISLFGDVHKIEQVLVNLVNNAVKYAPLSQEIVIQVEQVKGFAKISVIDGGPGIPLESVPKLFDRYYRLEQNRYTAGLGLGLYISAEIIARHGGDISVESIPGRGSNFWFTLPVRDA